MSLLLKKSYDAENRLITVNGGTSNGGTTYIYDAEGRRITKSGSHAAEYTYDAEGNMITELSSNGSWNRSDLIAAGRLWASIDYNTTVFHTVDWLGTRRVETDNCGNPITGYRNYPFGDNQTTLSLGSPCQTPSYDTERHFTGKERDAESGLDNFGARYNASTMGRFMSPDPFIPFNLKKDKFQAWISNPQHWNKYAYALNNPLLYVDPSGMTETIYYFLNKNLTDEQKKYFQEHKTDILNAVADKLKQAGIKDVVFKDGSSLSKSQVDSILTAQPKGVAFLNFANKSYAGVDAPSAMFGATAGMRSAVFVGNLQAGNPSASDLSFRISEVSDHELGHGMGFYSRGETMSFIEFWNKDLMNEGQGLPTKPRQFDMSIPQNRQAVDEINKLPEYNPPK